MPSDHQPIPLGGHRRILATGLAIRACQAGHRVAFATAHEWVARLAAAHTAGRLDAELDRLRRTPRTVHTVLHDDGIDPTVSVASPEHPTMTSQS